MNNNSLDQVATPLCHGMRRWPTLLAALIGVSAPTFVYALQFVQVPDASLVKYQLTPSGQVFFRNLNQFSPTALGCCYNYFIDTATQNGKNAFALFLAKQAQGKGFTLMIPDPPATGIIDYVGEY